MWNQLPSWYFWVEGEKRSITCARRPNVLGKYVISCKLKFIFFFVKSTVGWRGSNGELQRCLGDWSSSYTRKGLGSWACLV